MYALHKYFLLFFPHPKIPVEQVTQVHIHNYEAHGVSVSEFCVCIYTEDFIPEFPYFKAYMSVIYIYNIIIVYLGETSLNEVMQETGLCGFLF